MGENFSAERMAEVYLGYLFAHYPKNRHIRRVAGWLGMLLLGVEKIADKWWVSHTRQLCFEVRGKRYKAKFDHKIGSRGGITFVEVKPQRGQPEIRVAKRISNLTDAEAFYRKPRL
jgi:hypothetical protein